jgi:hypothetical protein
MVVSFYQRKTEQKSFLINCHSNFSLLHNAHFGATLGGNSLLSLQSFVQKRFL